MATAKYGTPPARAVGSRLAALDGLRIVFAFGNEGGTGPGGVHDAEFLSDLPGELAFLAEGSVQPASFLRALDAATGQFDLHPSSAIQSWWLNKNSDDSRLGETRLR
jgi:hypothetical protein